MRTYCILQYDITRLPFFVPATLRSITICRRLTGWADSHTGGPRLTTPLIAGSWKRGRSGYRLHGYVPRATCH
jgi:hypothetical protein